MAGTSNQKISFKKKVYNEATDSTPGAVVFDNTSNKIYVGGVCYTPDHDYTIIVDTAGSQAAKIGTSAETFTPQNGGFYFLWLKNSSTYNGKITLNVNGSGAKDVWYTGTETSSSYKPAAGHYIALYKNNIWYLQSPGRIPGTASNLRVTLGTPSAGDKELREGWRTLEVTIPGATSHLTNDSGYVTGSVSGQTVTIGSNSVTVPTNTNQLTNGAGFTTNTGTVTSVGLSNATNGGLTISGSPVTASGTITVGHTNVLASAQTTQGVYPIKIDKNGHISEYGTAVNIDNFKTKQTAVTSPTASTTTSTTFIDTISQDANGVITATKKTLPAASTTVAGITKVGASGGAAAYSHTHTFSSITSRGEAFLTWGGQNLSGAYAPIDAAMVGNLGANRTAFVRASTVTVEYSRDNGTTWTDYGASDSSKTAFFTNFGGSFVIGKSTTTNKATADCLLRVTLNTASSVYTVLNKFIIYLSTSGCSGCWCSIDCRTQTNYTNNTETWVNFANKVGVSGWSGYNVINTAGITTYGNTNSQYGQVRFTFGCTGNTSSYAGLTVNGVNCYGGVGWTTPSTMARTGHLYSYDTGQNATFPAGITATKFVKSGGTSSQFLKADGSVDSNSYSTTSHNHDGTYKPVQTAVSDPTASAATSTTFIDTISQNANGVITVTKKTLPSYSPIDHTHTLSDLTDTTITTPLMGDFLLYDDDSDMWENVTPSIIEIEESSGEIFEDALVDNDGNSYKAAIIGDQVWMVENLKTTTYTDGTTIPESDTYDTGNYYRTYPGETTENVAGYGRLYNGTAATHGVGIDNGQGGGRSVQAGSLLPEGWRIPTSSEFETLLSNIAEQGGGSSPKSMNFYGDSNEVYAVKFNPQYAGMVYGKAIEYNKGGEKISSGGRSNYYGFGEYMYMWSRTQEDNGGGNIAAKAGQSNSTQLNIVVCQYYDPNSGGGIDVKKGSNDVVVADNAHVYYGTEDTGNFCSIRGVYDGTPEEFLEEYYRTHQRPNEGDPTPDGKFLKNVGGNQLAWSDISYNDLKEKPFGETHLESSVSLSMENSNTSGYENTNPSSGVLCSYLYLSDTGISRDNLPTKMIIDGTIEVELDLENNLGYGNISYLASLYYDNSPYGDSTGEGWGIDLGEGYLYTLTSEFGNTPPTVELVFENTIIKKIDNKFLDLADVAFSGSYDDLNDLPDYFVTESEKGAANGVASLGSDGKVPVGQLPEDIGSSNITIRNWTY